MAIHNGGEDRSEPIDRGEKSPNLSTKPESDSIDLQAEQSEKGIKVKPQDGRIEAMTERLDKLAEILRGKLPDAEIQTVIEKLTTAAGDGSVSIGGDADEAVIVTGNKHIIGNNNQVIINHGTDTETIRKMLLQILSEQSSTQINISGIWHSLTGAQFQIFQNGNSFTFVGIDRVTGIRSEGSGIINGRSLTNEFRTSIPSIGTGTGMVSDDGRQMSGTFNDSYLGSYPQIFNRLG